MQAKTEKRHKMKRAVGFAQIAQVVDQSGIVISQNIHEMSMLNRNVVFSFIVLDYCHKGSARALYDMNEITHSKNELAILMPGHVIKPLECSDDYTFTRVAVSSELFADLRAIAFSHDYGKFHFNPICKLTDEQAERLLLVVKLLEIISSHETSDLQYRRQMLLTQLSIGYEFINYYRREQDKMWSAGRNAELYHRFCQLVVEHYRESREVKFYAEQLNMTPKHLTKIIRMVSGGITPSDWIEQYVVTRAKRLIETQPDHSIKEIAYTLGFDEPTTFHRYFKRVTGTTAKHFKALVLASKP